MLKAVNITKRFGGLTAVDRVNFQVKQGEILGVIGPNGSGKTTMISLISGTLPLTEGDIVYRGSSIKNLPPFRRARMGIARTFQIVKPLQNLSVRDNVMTADLFGGLRMGLIQEILSCLSTKQSKRAYQNTQKIIQTVGLDGKEDVLAHNLTLPDRKRLEVARALAMNPEVLLLDEVMAGLNLKEVEETMDLVKSINKQGVTVIMIEHIMKVIMGISDRIIVMDRGKLICEGSPESVAVDPKVIEAYLGTRFGKTGKGGNGDGNS